MSETLKTNIVVHDGMTPALKGMLSSLRIVINGFEDMQRLSGRAVDTRSISAARGELNRVEANFMRIENEILQSQQAQNRFNDSIQKGNSFAANLKTKIVGFVGAYAGMQGLKMGINATDNYSRGIAGLKLINDELQTQVELQAMVFSAAQRSRSGYGDMINSVAKLGLLASDSFNSTAETLRFSELMGKVFTVSRASTMEKQAGMHQLIQAMAAGKLQGDEFRSITENASLLAEYISDYTGKSKGQLKEMSADGEITAGIIKNALFSAADDIEDEFKKFPKTFGDIFTLSGNMASLAFSNSMQRIIDYLNTPIGDQFLVNFNQSIMYAKVLIDGLITVALNFNSIITKNWWWLAPTIMTIVGALTAYKLAMFAVNSVSALNVAWQTAQAIAIATHLGATVADTAAVHGLTVAQWALNSAMYANPIFWIVAGIIVLIGIIYIAVATYNHFAQASLSATGLIVGGIMVAVGLIANIFFGLLEFILGLIEVEINAFISFANFLANVFSNPLSAVVHMFGDMGDAVLGILSSIAGAIDFVFGSNLQGAVEGWRSNLGGMVNKISGDNYTEVFEKVDLSLAAFGIDRFNYGDMWNKGYDWGANISDSMKDFLVPDMPIMTDLLDMPTDGDIGKGIKDDTGKIKKSLEKSEDELKALRDLATIKAINRFSFDGININVNQKFGDVHQEMDLDGIGNIVMTKLENALDEFTSTSAEGVYDV